VSINLIENNELTRRRKPLPTPQDQLLDYTLNRYLVYAAIGLILVYAIRRVAIYLKRKTKARTKIFLVDPEAFFKLGLNEKKLTELENRSP